MPDRTRPKLPSALKPAARALRGRLLHAMRAPEPDFGMEATLAGLARRGFHPASVIDVGAAAGLWTELALRHWPDARYLLVEPLHERRAVLDALAGAHPNVRYELAAAGAAAGRLSINVAPDLFGTSFLYEGVEAREVPVVTVDGLVGEGKLAPPNFIKLDVQGYELDVLAGAARAMESCELILMEVRLFRGRPGMPMLHEAIAWMVERGFRPYELVDVLRRPLDGAMAQCDVLFAREGTALLDVEGWA